MSILKTNASHNALESTLEQQDGEFWITIAFATRLFNIYEMKY